MLLVERYEREHLALLASGADVSLDERLAEFDKALAAAPPPVTERDILNDRIWRYLGAA